MLLRSITLLSAPILLIEASDICSKTPGVEGDCRAQIGRWTYDPKTNTCVYFNYGGCGGNENNFYEFEDCIRGCADQETTIDVDKYLYALFGYGYENSDEAEEYDQMFKDYFEQQKKEILGEPAPSLYSSPERPSRPTTTRICNAEPLLTSPVVQSYKPSFKKPTPKKMPFTKINRDDYNDEDYEVEYEYTYEEAVLDRYYFDAVNNSCVHFYCSTCQEDDVIHEFNQFSDFRGCVDRCGDEDTKANFDTFEGPVEDFEEEFYDHKKYVMQSWRDAVFWDAENWRWVAPLADRVFSQFHRINRNKKNNPSISSAHNWIEQMKQKKN